MVADTSGWGSRFFPEVRICFRSSAPAVLPPRLQMLLLSVVLAGASAFAYLAAGRLGYEHLVAKKEAAVARARSATADLHKQLDALRQQLGGLARDRDRARGQAATLAGEAGTLRGRLSTTEAKLQSLEEAQIQQTQQQGGAAAPPSSAASATAAAGQISDLTKSLGQTQQALQQEKAQSAALAAQLAKIQTDRAAEEAQLGQYKTSLEQTAKEIEQLGAVRGKPAVRRARFHVRLGEIWQKLSEIKLPLLADQTAASTASATAAATTPGGVPVAELGPKEVGALETALRSAGVDVARILPQLGAATAEGGPFVPPPKSGGSTPVSPEKLAAIQQLAKTLPVSAPLASYAIGSPFGRRTDPFNGRAAFHTGIDMDAPYGSPVYATAPGTVIYAGWLGDYGKVVEIDHGLGIVTLYAHLRRWLVSVGEAVPAQQEIGLVGMTGRSTGPHVHYEVRVDGQPEDPEKFLGLARLLPAATPPQVTPAAAVSAGNNR